MASASKYLGNYQEVVNKLNLKGVPEVVLPQQSVGTTFEAFDPNYVDTLNYYSGCNALVRLILEKPGSVMNAIDPVAMIQWTVVDQVRHIFGYRSYRYDRSSRGTRIIAGSFHVPYRKSGLVRRKLYEINQNEEESWNEHKVREMRDEPLSIEAIKSNKAYRRRRQTDDIIANVNDIRAWPFPENFSFYIYFRHKEEGEAISIERSYKITGVTITNMEVQIDTSGQPIIESYQFIGRDISYTDTANLTS